LLGGTGAGTFVFSDGIGNNIVLDWEDGNDMPDFSAHRPWCVIHLSAEH
jgi:hypothetical protein